MTSPRKWPTTVAQTRPILAWSGIDAPTYRSQHFERDLARVLAKQDGPYTRVSVACFCPEFPDVPFCSDPGRAFQSLSDSRWFLCAFFAAQLADQATHFVTGRVTQNRAGTYGQLILVGLLGSGQFVMDPTFLLLVLALYEPRDVGVLVGGLKDLVAAEFDELHDRDAAQKIVAAAAASLEFMPDSLRAFLPYGDDYKWQPDGGIVRALRQAAAEGLSRTAV